jgi:hypothetical protein
MINKWRLVEYTDDGCSLYECLQCEGRWESRSAPGWFTSHVDTECLVKGGHTVLEGPDRKPRYYTERAEPLYMAYWLWCPICGTKWEGPLRCNVDNERMLGPRRLRIANAYRYHARLDLPDYYYTVESAIRDGSLWYTRDFIDPRRFTAADVLKYVRKLRQEEYDNCQGFEMMKPNSFRVGIKRSDGRHQPTRNYL